MLLEKSNDHSFESCDDGEGAEHVITAIKMDYVA